MRYYIVPGVGIIIESSESPDEYTLYNNKTKKFTGAKKTLELQLIINKSEEILDPRLKELVHEELVDEHIKQLLKHESVRN